MTFGQRFLLTLAIVLALLFALALFGFFSGGWDDADAQALGESKSYIVRRDPAGLVINLCVSDEALREKVRQAMLDGLDEALRSQVENVFSVWMRDTAGQPERAAVGVRKAVSAYMQARVGALNWQPPICAAP